MENRRHNKIDSWDEGVYGTGKTEPPKESSGLTALLMMVIIFLSGIISVLSFLNIQLFHQLQQAQIQTDSVPMAFSQMEPESRETVMQEPQEISQAVKIPKLGISGELISTFDQHYFSWPPGLLVTLVNEKGKGFALGLETGDIITTINGLPLTNQEQLDAIFNAGISEPFTLEVYQNGVQVTLSGNP